jgi:hypothetical protein
VTDAEQLESLRAISAKASLHAEGGATCVLLPGVHLTTADGDQEMDVVLCPRGLGGYKTRLLLARKVAGKPSLNWQVVVLLGQSWHTWSWNEISADQPWLRIYAEHARILR